MLGYLSVFVADLTESDGTASDGLAEESDLIDLLIDAAAVRNVPRQPVFALRECCLGWLTTAASIAQLVDGKTPFCTRSSIG